MADQYTHEFKFQLGDGSQFVEGEIEFNTDGKVSYKVDAWSQPIGEETLRQFNEVCQLMKSLFAEFGGIKLIRFKVK